MPAEYGKIADEPGFRVGEARANVNVSSTRFQIGPAYAGSILQAGGHQVDPARQRDNASLFIQRTSRFLILILPSFCVSVLTQIVYTFLASGCIHGLR